MPGGVPEPNEMPLIPRFASSGMVARVHPGTSRCETAVGVEMPKSLLNDAVISSAALNVDASG